MNTKKQQLISNMETILLKSENVGIFEYKNLTVVEFEKVRSAAHKHSINPLVVKNTLCSIALKNQGFKNIDKLKDRILITYSDNPASCVSFLSSIKDSSLKKKLNPISVINRNNKCSLSIKQLITMGNADGIKVVLLNILKNQQIKLIKLLQLKSNQ